MRFHLLYILGGIHFRETYICFFYYYWLFGSLELFNFHCDWTRRCIKSGELPYNHKLNYLQFLWFRYFIFVLNKIITILIISTFFIFSSSPPPKKLWILTNFKISYSREALIFTIFVNIFTKNHTLYSKRNERYWSWKY